MRIYLCLLTITVLSYAFCLEAVAKPSSPKNAPPQNTMTQQDPSCPLQIIKAEFGTDKAMLDVSNKLIAMIKDKKLDLLADSKSFEDQRNIPGKKFRLAYKYEGRENKMEVPEGTRVQIPMPQDPSCPLQIIKAEFGPANAMQTVTDNVVRLIKNKKLDIVANSATFADSGKVKGKKFKLIYKLDGKESTLNANEGAYVQIPDAVPDEYTRSEYPENRENLANIDFDYYGFPFYIGNVFPEAQDAVYSDKFIPVNEVSVVLGPNIKKDDLRIILLCKKLEKWGAKVEITDKPCTAKTQIMLNFPSYGTAAPQKPEGYSINCTEKDGNGVIAVNGYDKRGLLWGIVSVLQLTKHENGELAMRSAEIKDYPDHVVRRGPLSGRWDRAYELMIFAKMNCIVVQDEPFEGHGWCWRIPGPPKLAFQRFADICYGLGLEYYTKIHPAESTPKFIASDEKDCQQLIWLIKKYYASRHMDLYWAYDDIRFNEAGFPPQDKKKFGSAGKADAYAVQRLYTEVKKEYPDFKMVFCPPYYWTTGIYRSLYGESGVEYIKSLAQTLDPEIGVYWTGQQVGSYGFPKEAVAEITAMMGRKPCIFKNRPGYHQGNRAFPCDEYGWEEYNGLCDDLKSLNPNTMGAPMFVVDATACDWCWNTKKYVPARSTKNAVSMILGPELYPLLKTLGDKLCEFDAYAPGAGRVATASALSAANVTELAKSLDTAREILEKAKALDKKNLIGQFTAFNEAFSWSEGCVKDSRNPKFLNGLPGYAVRDTAYKETSFDKKKDSFFSVEDLSGDFIKGNIPGKSGTRFAKLIYGSKTQESSIFLRFGCDPYPPSGDFDLCISGRVFAKGADCRMIVKLNDSVVYDGPSGLGNDSFEIKKITLPATMINKSNTLLISNGENTSSYTEPCIAISYLVMKKP